MGRLVVSPALLILTYLGVASPAANAANKTSIRCPESAHVGSKPTESDAAAERPEGGPAAADPQGSTGLRVCVDPETGEFTVPPSDVRAAEQSAAAFSTSHEGLVETSSPGPGGGVMVDLEGRFRSPLTATVGTDGKLKMYHRPCIEASEEGK
jgi:hypothetical protein